MPRVVGFRSGRCRADCSRARGAGSRCGMVGHRPIPKTRIPGSIPSAHWRPGCRRNTGCFGRYCSTGRIANCWKIAGELPHHRASLLLDRFAFRFLTRLFWLARFPGSTCGVAAQVSACKYRPALLVYLVRIWLEASVSKFADLVISWG